MLSLSVSPRFSLISVWCTSAEVSVVVGSHCSVLVDDCVIFITVGHSIYKYIYILNIFLRLDAHIIRLDE